MGKIRIEEDAVKQIVKVMKGQKQTHNREFWAGVFGAIATLIDGVNKGLDTQVKVFDQRIKIREIEDKAVAEAKTTADKAEERAQEAEKRAKEAPAEQKAAADKEAIDARTEATTARTKANNTSYTEKVDTTKINIAKKDWMVAQELSSYAVAAFKAGQDFCKALAIDSTPSKGELDYTGKLINNDNLNAISMALNTESYNAEVVKAFNKATKAKKEAEDANAIVQKGSNYEKPEDKNTASANMTNINTDFERIKEIYKKDNKLENDATAANDYAETIRTAADNVKTAANAWLYREIGDELKEAALNACEAITTAFADAQPQFTRKNDVITANDALNQLSPKDSSTTEAKNTYNSVNTEVITVTKLMRKAMEEVPAGKINALQAAKTNFEAIKSESIAKKGKAL